jgi:hypothetical protein
MKEFPITLGLTMNDEPDNLSSYNIMLPPLFIIPLLGISTSTLQNREKKPGRHGADRKVLT